MKKTLLFVIAAVAIIGLFSCTVDSTSGNKPDTGQNTGEPDGSKPEPGKDAGGESKEDGGGVQPKADETQPPPADEVQPVADEYVPVADEYEPPPPPEEIFGYVLNGLQLAEAGTGFDVDEDGTPDNSFAELLAALGGVLPADPNQQLADAVAQGNLIILLHALGIQDFMFDDGFKLNGYGGEDLDADASDNFSGSEEFGINPSSYDENGDPQISFHDVVIDNGVFFGGPSLFVLSMPLIQGQAPMDILIDRARIKGNITSADIVDGLLGGAIPKDDLITALNQIPEIQQYIGLVTILLNRRCDIDLDGDGTMDAISIALTFTAVSAVINE